MELRKEYVGFLSAGRLYVFRTGVFLPPNTSYGEQVCMHARMLTIDRCSQGYLIALHTALVKCYMSTSTR